MDYSKNFTLSQFQTEITDRFTKKLDRVGGKIDQETYQKEAGRVAAEARNYFFEGNTVDIKAEKFPDWLEDIKSFLGKISEETFDEIIKFNNGTINDLKQKSSSIIPEKVEKTPMPLRRALALHYRLHMYIGDQDRQFARDLDRLVFSGSTFEKAIGKPVFSYEPGTYYDHSPMSAPIWPPEYISEAQAKAILKDNIDHGIWLNPHNHFTIPLHGRDDEKKRLTKFMEHSALFRVQPVIAPSGAGKTRLISEWMRAYSATVNPKTEWEAGFLVSGLNDQARNPEPWRNWEIKKTR